MIDMEKPKNYCPFCKQELNGATHKNEGYAWSEFNCEYNSTLQDEKPLTELVIKKELLKRKVAMKKAMDIDVRRLKTRIAELCLVK